MHLEHGVRLRKALHILHRVPSRATTVDRTLFSGRGAPPGTIDGASSGDGERKIVDLLPPLHSPILIDTGVNRFQVGEAPKLGGENLSFFGVMPLTVLTENHAVNRLLPPLHRFNGIGDHQFRVSVHSIEVERLSLEVVREVRTGLSPDQDFCTRRELLHLASQISGSVSLPRSCPDHQILRGTVTSEMSEDHSLKTSVETCRLRHHLVIWES